MKNALNSYHWIIVILLILSILICLAIPFAKTIGNKLVGNVSEINNSREAILEHIKDEDFFGKEENCTYYTQENITALAGRGVSIGQNNPLHVVGIYSEDRSEIVISKNGKNSDGIMKSELFVDNHTLNSVIIKKGVVNIGQDTFRGCSNLTYVNLPDGLKTIEKGGFAGTAITTITIPTTVITIHSGAFADCSNLETIIFEGDTLPAEFKGSEYPGVTVIVKGN